MHVIAPTRTANAAVFKIEAGVSQSIQVKAVVGAKSADPMDFAT